MQRMPSHWQFSQREQAKVPTKHMHSSLEYHSHCSESEESLAYEPTAAVPLDHSEWPLSAASRYL